MEIYWNIGRLHAPLSTVRVPRRGVCPAARRASVSSRALATETEKANVESGGTVEVFPGAEALAAYARGKYRARNLSPDDVEAIKELKALLRAHGVDVVWR